MVKEQRFGWLQCHTVTQLYTIAIFIAGIWWHMDEARPTYD